MILDDYKQIYVGQADDMRKRIKQHWSGAKQFDRLLFGPVEVSILSIDSFRALDTTRVIAAKTRATSALEQKVEEAVPASFRLNRLSGGRLDWMEETGRVPYGFGRRLQ
nr:GIY-YIG nuclease family protein [Zhihengliuella flava]